jgi:hypothetical protein
MDNIENHNSEEEALWMSQSPHPSSDSCSSLSCTESKSDVSLVEGKWAGSGKNELDSEL